MNYRNKICHVLFWENGNEPLGMFLKYLMEPGLFLNGYFCLIIRSDDQSIAGLNSNGQRLVPWLTYRWRHVAGPDCARVGCKICKICVVVQPVVT